MSFEERSNGMIAIAKQFLKLSDEAALSIAKFADRKKLEQERQNANEGLRYDTPPYRREHYVELFKYLDSQLEKDNQMIEPDVVDELNKGQFDPNTEVEPEPEIREFVETTEPPTKKEEEIITTAESDWRQDFSAQPKKR